MLSQNKKGVSEIVSYVLLISVTFVVSGVVFLWLQFYVTPDEDVKCEDGISLVIRGDYHYNCTTMELNFTLQNRGLFDIDGYIVRVSTSKNSKIGIYRINLTGSSLESGDLSKHSYIGNKYFLSGDTSSQSGSFDGEITLLEVQPFSYLGGSTPIYCESIARQKISCST